MSYLCRKAKEALEKNDKENLLKFLRKQEDFMEKHLIKWVPQLAGDIQESADTDFYKGFGKILGRYVQYDREVIGTLIKETQSFT